MRKSLGNILYEHRISRNLSLDRAAREIGISYTTYWRLENDVACIPRYQVAEKIAKWLNMPVEELRNKWL